VAKQRGCAPGGKGEWKTKAWDCRALGLEGSLKGHRTKKSTNKALVKQKMGDHLDKRLKKGEMTI